MKFYKLILFGGNRLLELAPFGQLIKYLRKKNIKFLVITDKTHLEKKITKSKNFKQLLIKEKIVYKSYKKIKLENIKKYIDKTTIGLSLNAIWKFDKKLIKYFKGNLFNYHAGDLPSERGAGVISWRIMLQKKSHLSINIHKVSAHFDMGDIVLSKKIKTNKKDLLPFEHLKNQLGFEEKFLQNFINTILSKKKLLNRKQLNKNSYYWPRLNSKIHGKINWNWAAKDIVLFIKAFSIPFDGSYSFIGKKRIRIYNAKFNRSKIRFHPYQNGIIYKIENNKFFISNVKNYITINLKDTNLELEDFHQFLGKRFK